ncbi:hypothetical protein [Acetonema longum]|nr:hypothetical protein [Acetonema longum]
MIVIKVNLNTGEREVIDQYNDPEDRPISDVAQYLLPDVLKKIKERDEEK